jgi:DNA-binding response OmpR family regulator
MTVGRENCLEAGASDYIPKPVNTDQLLPVMREFAVNQKGGAFDTKRLQSERPG